MKSFLKLQRLWYRRDSCNYQSSQKRKNKMKRTENKLNLFLKRKLFQSSFAEKRVLKDFGKSGRGISFGANENDENRLFN